MITVIHQYKYKARKNYNCDACNNLFESDICDLGLTFTEYRSVVKAKQNNSRILKGETYLRQFNRDDSNNTWVFRAIPEIHEICIKYKLYEE